MLRVGCWSTPKPKALNGLPRLNEGNVEHDATSNNPPLPCQTTVLEHLRVEDGNVDEGEGDEEAGNHRPEQELVVVDGLENRQGAGIALVHGEQRAVEVLDFP